MDDRTALMTAKPLDEGYQLSCYTIQEVLGKGGFGITYLALDNNLDREVAIKEYLPTSFAHRHIDHSVKPITGDHRDHFTWGLDNFLKEAKTLAKFNHENIVRVHTVFEANSTAYMVMEYEQGDNLASIIKNQGVISQESQEKIFFPIIDGLNRIHELGFIHRDVKPANIYIRHNGTPVLIDFGSARQTSLQETNEFTALISQGYTPLEQYSADYGGQGPWTDLYSIAATMYHCTTGSKPDDSLSRSACMLRSQPDRVKLLSASDYPGFDQNFFDALFAGLHLQPEKRPQTLKAWQKQFQSNIGQAESGVTQETRDESTFSNRVDHSGTTATPSQSMRISGKESDNDLDISFDEDPFSDIELEIGSAHQRTQPPKKKKTGIVLFSVLVAAAAIAGAVFYFLGDDTQDQSPVAKNETTEVDVTPKKPLVAIPKAEPSETETTSAETIEPTTTDNPQLVASESTQQPEPEPEPEAITVLFATPLAHDSHTPARSIEQLAKTTPAEPPIAGLDEELWKNQTCSSCHDWSRANLCQQGEFYVAKDAQAIARIAHPFGGLLKSALRDWAAAGCQ